MKVATKIQRSIIDNKIVYVGMMACGEYDEYNTQAVSAGTLYPAVLSLLKLREYQYTTHRRKWIEVYLSGSHVETIDVEEIED